MREREIEGNCTLIPKVNRRKGHNFSYCGSPRMEASVFACVSVDENRDPVACFYAIA